MQFSKKKKYTYVCVKFVYPFRSILTCFDKSRKRFEFRMKWIITPIVTLHLMFLFFTSPLWDFFINDVAKENWIHRQHTMLAMGFGFEFGVVVYRFATPEVNTFIHMHVYMYLPLCLYFICTISDRVEWIQDNNCTGCPYLSIESVFPSTNSFNAETRSL